MPLIVTLSSILTYDIEKSFSAFINLCAKNLEVSPQNTSFFKPPSSIEQAQQIINTLYETNLENTVNPYKRGEMTTDNFLEKMFDIFPFIIREAEARVKANTLAQLSDETQEQIFTLNPNESDSRLIAKALFEQAWTTAVSFTENDENKLLHLINLAENDQVYFISNTNPLDINKILNLFHDVCPSVQNHVENILSPTEKHEKSIAIANNMYMCLSYQYQTFKAPETPLPEEAYSSLLQTVVTDLRKTDTSKNIKFISIYKDELEYAKTLEIECEDSAEYFKAALAALMASPATSLSI
jgi:hypothetical protein